MRRSTPWSWLIARAASSLLVLAALCAWSVSAHAVTIHNVTSNTTLFSDNFENQTVGSAPDTSLMNPGAPGSSWSSSAGGNGSSRNVVDTAIGTTFPPDAPGPYEGSNYLLIDIPRNRSGYGASATASFTAPSAGDTLEISFAYAWGTGGTENSDGYSGNDAGGPQLQLFDSSDTRAIWMDSGDENFHFYSSDGNTEIGTIPNAKGALGTWHTFKLTYTQGTSDMTVTVDGNETVLAGAVADGTLLPDHLVLNTTRAGVIAFDAIPTVPEPTALALAGVALIGGLATRGNRRFVC